MGMINIRVVGGGKVKIGGKVSGALGGMVHGGYTDHDGYGILEWSSDTFLSVIFIDGKGHHGKFRSGETYTF